MSSAMVSRIWPALWWAAVVLLAVLAVLAVAPATAEAPAGPLGNPAGLTVAPGPGNAAASRYGRRAPTVPAAGGTTPPPPIPSPSTAWRPAGITSSWSSPASRRRRRARCPAGRAGATSSGPPPWRATAGGVGRRGNLLGQQRTRADGRAGGPVCRHIGRRGAHLRAAGQRAGGVLGRQPLPAVGAAGGGAVLRGERRLRAHLRHQAGQQRGVLGRRGEGEGRGGGRTATGRRRPAWLGFCDG